MAENLTTQFTDGTSSDATQSVFNTLLLVRATYDLIHQVPVKKYNLARRSGKTMIFRRYDPLEKAKTPLREGTPPAGKQKSKSDISMTIQPYGDFIEDTDMVMDTQPDAQSVENTELLGQQMGETFDELYRDMWTAASNTVYPNGTSTLTVTNLADRDTYDRAIRLLRVNKAKPFSPAVFAGQKIGTSAIMPAYWGMIDERVYFDLRHTEGFVLPVNYANGSGTIAGEGGSDKYGIRYLVSPNGHFLPGATGVTAAGTDLKNTGGFLDMYSVFIVGKEAAGGINLAGGNGGVIRKALGSAGTADPLDQKQTIGWKKYDARTILNQAFLVEVQTPVSR